MCKEHTIINNLMVCYFTETSRKALNYNQWVQHACLSNISPQSAPPVHLNEVCRGVRYRQESCCSRKDIGCQKYHYTLTIIVNYQAKYKAKAKWTVDVVIADDHFGLPPGSYEGTRNTKDSFDKVIDACSFVPDSEAILYVSRSDYCAYALRRESCQRI